MDTPPSATPSTLAITVDDFEVKTDDEAKKFCAYSLTVKEGGKEHTLQRRWNDLKLMYEELQKEHKAELHAARDTVPKFEAHSWRLGASESSRQRRTGLLLARSLVDASSSFAPADREKCREDAAALADVLATDDLPLVRMDAALLLAAPIAAGDGVVQRLAGDDDPDVSEAGFNALKAREERVRDDSSCAVDLGSQSTVQMDMVEPADVEVVDDEPTASSSSGAPS